MLTSSNFWIGVGVGLVGCYAWRYMKAQKAAGS